MAYARILMRYRKLECDEFAIVAYHRIRCSKAGIIAEISQPLIIAAAIEFQLP